MRALPLLLIPLSLAGCAFLGIPAHAIRSTPPTGIEAQALAVGADAPLVPGIAQPEVLVFYRGHW